MNLFGKIQYLAVYTINGTNLGTSYTTAVDFAKSNIKDKAGATAGDILEIIFEQHNREGLQPVLNNRNEIGITVLTRIN